MTLSAFNSRTMARIRTLDWLQLYEGPVRSGKTVASVLSLIYLIASRPVRTAIMSGNTVGSLRRNVIDGEFGFLALCPGSRLVMSGGVERITVPTDHGLVTLYLFGGGKADSADPLRGLSADAWYADEITKHHRSFIEEAFARTSASDVAVHIWTSNPDNPHHYVYAEWTDRFKAMSPEEKRQLGGYHEFRFRLSDNPAMTPDKIRSLELRYTGVEYRRKVLGERCVAEGLVYPGFGQSCIARPPDAARLYCASIDFGAVHPTAMGWYARDGRTWYKVREWRATEEQSRSMTVSDYMDTFERITRELGGLRRDRLCIDYGGGGEALVREAERRRWFPVDPDKSVLDGIASVGMMLAEGTLMLSPDCPLTAEELAGYRWDERASQRGEDRPVKERDDLADETRYAVSTFMEPRMRRRRDEDRKPPGFLHDDARNRPAD